MSCPKYLKKEFAGRQMLPFSIDCENCLTNDIRLLIIAVISVKFVCKVSKKNWNMQQ